MDPVRPVPRSLPDRVSAFLSGGREAAAPRGASTVVLLRQGAEAEGIEVYVLRRHPGMAFAAGMYAFPGGTVDSRDTDASVGWAGPDAAEWARRLECGPAEARALVCAAMRETFEEAGVLLAGPTADTVVGDTTGDDWELDRVALVDRQLSFTDFLERRRLVLRTDLLAAWAHWITPEFEPRRYDTWFFVAVMPPCQHTRDVSGEADHVAWMRPADALAAVDAGEMEMLPPTSITLREISAYPSPAEAIEAAGSRVIATIMPRGEIVDGEVVLTDTAGPSS